MGDLLFLIIYIFYLKMFQGLVNGFQCVYYCFSLFKVNGSSYVENIQGVGGSFVFWEYFFYFLMFYYEYFWKDFLSVDSVQYCYFFFCGIIQKE